MVRWAAGALFLASLTLAGCQSAAPGDSPAAVEAVSPAALAAELSSPATPTYTVTPSPVPTWTPSVTVVPATEPTTMVTIVPTETPLPTETPTPAATATPAPTFTPPPYPTGDNQAAEHYLLNRPIPAEYTNWTDRIYPYGSTRGGVLATHHGVEFSNPVGVPVMAAEAGVVVTAGADDPLLVGPRNNYYGLVVVILHDLQVGNRPVYTLYGHLSEVLVAEGQRVAAGELVGLVGGTGAANGGPHLHFEVRVGENGFAMTRNPSLWLRPFAGQGMIVGQLVWADGSPVYGATLSIQRADVPQLFVNRTVTTYADDSVNADDAWQENFVVADMEPGPYLVTLLDGEIKLSQLVWVFPGYTSWVRMQLGGS